MFLSLYDHKRVGISARMILVPLPLCPGPARRFFLLEEGKAASNRKKGDVSEVVIGRLCFSVREVQELQSV